MLILCLLTTASLILQNWDLATSTLALLWDVPKHAALMPSCIQGRLSCFHHCRMTAASPRPKQCKLQQCTDTSDKQHHIKLPGPWRGCPATHLGECNSQTCSPTAPTCYLSNSKQNTQIYKKINTSLKIEKNS